MSLPSAMVENTNDGGYYAIKGFLYQFDVTILEILNNPEKEVNFEQVQDINYEDYIIQVKHKESQSYNDSKIRRAIVQLLDLYINDQTKRFCLYCHFKDKTPHMKILKLSELDNILGESKSKYKKTLRSLFIKNFYIQYSHDYHAQFIQILDILKRCYNLTDTGEALYYHSVIRSRLLELIIMDKTQRKINKSNLDDFIKESKRIIFHSSYADFLERDRYERLVKRQFFTISKPNLDNFERLFIVSVDEKSHAVTLQQIIGKVMSKFYRENKSPAPYICFRNVNSNVLNFVKQSMLDQSINFKDGTFFDGDKFRIDKLIERDSKTMVKIIHLERLDELIAKYNFHVVYQFYIDDVLNLETNTSTKQYFIHIEDSEQITHMVN